MAVVAVVLTLVASTFAGSAPAASAPASPTSAGSLDPALVARLEAALDEGFEASGMPGVIVGLWVPGQGEWIGVRGVADLETMEPATRDNQQKIASITKTFVGSVALQVIGEPGYGLSLDDTIDEWYPDFPLASQITVRMLLNMSSGIGATGFAQVERICADPYGEPTPDDFVAIGAATPRAGFAPGAGFEYSNFNTAIVGRILEKVTGTDLGTLIDDRLVEPFGLTRSRFAPDGQVVAPVTHGYTWFCENLPQPSDTVDWTTYESWGGSGMVSTLDDLHRWGLALGAGAGVSPELQLARLTEVAPNSGPDGNAYGLGINVHRDVATNCVLDLMHTGSEPGYGTFVGYFNTTGSVFALLGNGDGGTGDKFESVLRAVYPAFIDTVTVTPTESCETPVTPMAPVAPVGPAPARAVATAPTFAG